MLRLFTGEMQKPDDMGMPLQLRSGIFYANLCYNLKIQRFPACACSDVQGRSEEIF